MFLISVRALQKASIHDEICSQRKSKIPDRVIYLMSGVSRVAWWQERECFKLKNATCNRWNCSQWCMMKKLINLIAIINLFRHKTFTYLYTACLPSWWTQYKLADPPEWCIYCNRSVNIMLGIMRLMIVKDEVVINNLEYLTAACSHEAPGGWEAAKCSKSVHLYFVQTTDCRDGAGDYSQTTDCH